MSCRLIIIIKITDLYNAFRSEDTEALRFTFKCAWEHQFTQLLGVIDIFVAPMSGWDRK